MDDLAIIARIILGGCFCFAGVRKIFSHASFYNSVISLQLIRSSWARILARVLPWIELLAGAMLFVEQTMLASAILLLTMLMGFSTALTLAFRRQGSVDCHCFGNSDMPTSYGQAITRNLLLGLLAIYAVATATTSHPLVVWQLFASQEVVILLASLGLIMAFRMSMMIWYILQRAVQM